MEYELISQKKYNNVIEQIFYNRGFKNAEDIKHYLNTDDSDILDPSKIMNIKQGVKMLISHISQNHDVLLQIDSDADGFTSSAILINYLNLCFPSFVKNHIKYWVHDSKAHGIDEQGLNENIKLIIALDASSNEYEKHEKLHNMGIDILVIDHHNASEISPYACVINNQLCDYPTKSLSGAGMVYKFCCYIDSLLGTDNANSFLDLASLGIISDVMMLTDFETKRIIQKGLSNIRNPFLKMIINNDQRYFPKGKPISIKSIAWSIGPLVNAVTRVGTVEEKLLLFESMLEYKSYEQIPSTKRGCKGQMETRVEQAVRTCKNIKNRQDKSRDSLVEEVEKIIKDNDLNKNKILAIKIENVSETNKNITGLVANKIMSKYQKPTLLLNKTIDENGDIFWMGSGRGITGSDFNNFQKFLIDSNLVEFAEGHHQAFGANISDKNFKNLIEYANEELKDINFSIKHNVDVIYELSDYENIENDILSIAELKSIWGQGIQEPLIAFSNIKLTNGCLQLMGAKKNTWKITTNSKLSFIKFNSSEELFKELVEPYGSVTIDLVGTCEINDWNGAPQINIVDYEIKERNVYDF